MKENRVVTTAAVVLGIGVLLGAGIYVYKNPGKVIAAISGTISFSNNRLVNLVDPINLQDAVTKNYVLSASGGSSFNGTVASCSTSGTCTATASCNSGTVIIEAVSNAATGGAGTRSNNCGVQPGGGSNNYQWIRGDCYGATSCSETGNGLGFGACVAIVCGK